MLRQPDGADGGEKQVTGVEEGGRPRCHGRRKVEYK